MRSSVTTVEVYLEQRDDEWRPVLERLRTPVSST
jgi:hypothetical protein